MAKTWHKKMARRAPPGPSEPLIGIRKLMSWGPFLDLDVAKVARDTEPVFTPTFDILETEAYYAFLADLPGIRRESLDISWTAGRITIAGEREPEALAERADYYALERTFGCFSRSFTLPAGACADQTSATLKDGVLTVLVPKAPAGEPSRIPIGDEIPVLGKAQ